MRYQKYSILLHYFSLHFHHIAIFHHHFIAALLQTKIPQKLHEHTSGRNETYSETISIQHKTSECQSLGIQLQDVSV